MLGASLWPCERALSSPSFFSYKRSIFIFYAKVTQRIYIKLGEGQSRELLGQPLPHSHCPSKGGHPSLGCASSYQGAQRMGLGLACAPPHLSLGVLEAESRSRSKSPSRSMCFLVYPFSWQPRALVLQAEGLAQTRLWIEDLTHAFASCPASSFYTEQSPSPPDAQASDKLTPLGLEVEALVSLPFRGHNVKRAQ